MSDILSKCKTSGKSGNLLGKGVKGVKHRTICFRVENFCPQNECEN